MVTAKSATESRYECGRWCWFMVGNANWCNKVPI